MSAVADQPFSEYEQRFILTEILKESSISPLELLQLIRERNIEPRWGAVRIPVGRSVDSCIANYRYMQGWQTAPVGLPQSYPFVPQAQQPQPPPPKRLSSELSPGRPTQTGPGPVLQAYPGPLGRPLSALQTTTAETPIQARPQLSESSMQRQFSQFAAVNEPTIAAPYRTGPEPLTTGSERKTSKKRGRPSKAESESRAAQAAARGEVYPPPKKTKIPRTSGATGAGPVSGEVAERAATGKSDPRRTALGLSSVSASASQPSGPMVGESLVTPDRPTQERSPQAFSERMEVDTPESPRDRPVQGAQGPGLTAEDPVSQGEEERAGSPVRAPTSISTVPVSSEAGQSGPVSAQAGRAKPEEQSESTVTKA